MCHNVTHRLKQGNVMTEPTIFSDKMYTAVQANWIDRQLQSRNESTFIDLYEAKKTWSAAVEKVHLVDLINDDFLTSFRKIHLSDVGCKKLRTSLQMKKTREKAKYNGNSGATHAIYVTRNTKELLQVVSNMMEGNEHNVTHSELIEIALKMMYEAETGNKYVIK